MKKTILLVEDEEKLYELYLRILQRTPYEILLATNKQEAKKILKEKRLDLILLDLIIPAKPYGVLDFNEREGFKIIEESKRPLPPFIIFTNIDTEDDRQKAKKLGAKKYIVKVNFLPKQIISLVKECLK